MALKQSYKDLKVWQRAMDLVLEIYKITARFPKSETYGLVSQMRRAAVAVASNIAEGQKRSYLKEFLQFLFVSYGSGAELETQVEICKKLDNLKDLDYSKTEIALAETMKMLNGLIASLKKKL